ncbi:MAG: ROK family protein, partial [Lachnospiraceae bacterium]|nr:ROK family protein [Lachnospiraceae bacterium]
MNKYGIEVEVKRVPELDPDFLPLGLYQKAFLASAGTAHPVGIAVERADGQMSVHHTYVHGTEEMREADCYYID